eukprot:jgi/Ulvmu1/5185/UM021_0202.1
MDVAVFVKRLPGLMAAVRNVEAGGQEGIEALRQLRVQFLELLHTDVLEHNHDVQQNTAGKTVAYLVEQYQEFRSLLLLLIKRLEAPVQMEAWHALMECVRAEKVGHFNHELFREAVQAFLTSKRTTCDAVEQFIARYLGNWDVRYFWLHQVEKLSHAVADGGLQQASQDPSTARILYAALSPLEVHIGEAPQSWCGGLEIGVLATAPTRSEGTKARRKRKRVEAAQVGNAATPTAAGALWASQEAQVTSYSDAWLAFLRLPMPEPLLKGLLPVVTSKVIANIKNPVALSDFLTKATEQGGLVGILALQGLFLLVTQHGLEHPDFYKRLYALLTPQVFTARYRVKFLQLVDIFLASSMVPAYSAAAFAKKFARLSVVAPPVGALACLAFVHNLIRRHPSCVCLIHRPSKGAAEETGDAYDPEALEMDDSKGIESSLWELTAMRVHLDPTVAIFAQRFDLDITNRKKVAEIDMQSVLTARYKTQVYEVLDKKARRAPAVSITDIDSADHLQLGDLIGCSA